MLEFDLGQPTIVMTEHSRSITEQFVSNVQIRFRDRSGQAHPRVASRTSTMLRCRAERPVSSRTSAQLADLGPGEVRGRRSGIGHVVSMRGPSDECVHGGPGAFNYRCGEPNGMDPSGWMCSGSDVRFLSQPHGGHWRSEPKVCSRCSLTILRHSSIYHSSSVACDVDSSASGQYTGNIEFPIDMAVDA